jgi:hypothetical protein
MRRRELMATKKSELGELEKFGRRIRKLAEELQEWAPYSCDGFDGVDTVMRSLGSAADYLEVANSHVVIARKRLRELKR